MMSKSGFTFGEQETIRRSREPTVITSASDKAESTEESTEEATVFTDDLGLFMAMMLLED